MNDLTNERLDQIETTAKAATSGPWYVGEHQGDIAIRDNAEPIVFAVSSARNGFLDILDEDAEHIANMDPTTTLALIHEVRELRNELALLRDADQDATGRLAASEHLIPKWHPKLRQLMRERNAAIAERDEAREAASQARRAVKKVRAQAERMEES